MACLTFADHLVLAVLVKPQGQLERVGCLPATGFETTAPANSWSRTYNTATIRRSRRSTAGLMRRRPARTSIAFLARSQGVRLPGASSSRKTRPRTSPRQVPGDCLWPGLGSEFFLSSAESLDHGALVRATFRAGVQLAVRYGDGPPRGDGELEIALFGGAWSRRTRRRPAPSSPSVSLSSSSLHPPRRSPPPRCPRSGT